jgi:uncharacterized protein YgiB involved in biofilm formation
MKRTRTTKLLLMGLSPFVLAACENSSRYSSTYDNASVETLYPSAESCIASGTYPADDCRAAFSAAVAEHQAHAPRYDSEQFCIEQHGEGACTEQTSTSGQSSFLPFMAGMMMGRAFNTGFSRPAYPSRTQPFTAGAGQYWSGGSNPVQRVGQALPPPPPPGKVITQSRSGFGSQHSSRSYGG